MNNRFPDNVVVSLLDRERGFQTDAVLPSTMKTGRIKIGLLRLLRQQKPKLYALCRGLEISMGGIKLDDELNFEQMQIWDGTELTIRVFM